MSSGSARVEFCMLCLYLHGFHAGSPVSSHCPKTYRWIGWSKFPRGVHGALRWTGVPSRVYSLPRIGSGSTVSRNSIYQNECMLCVCVCVQDVYTEPAYHSYLSVLWLLKRPGECLSRTQLKCNCGFLSCFSMKPGTSSFAATITDSC